MVAHIFMDKSVNLSVNSQYILSACTSNDSLMCHHSTIINSEVTSLSESIKDQASSTITLLINY